MGAYQKLVLAWAGARNPENIAMLFPVVDVVAGMSPVLGKVEDDVGDIRRQLLASGQHNSDHDNVNGRRLIWSRPVICVIILSAVVIISSVSLSTLSTLSILIISIHQLHPAQHVEGKDMSHDAEQNKRGEKKLEHEWARNER